MPSLLSPDELTAALADLPGVHWSEQASEGQLVIQTQSTGFPEAVALINDVAAAAEQLGHHPDIDLRWNTVSFILSTHSEGGITALDVGLAQKILDLAKQAGAVIQPA
jgi:4a-hydroxytetrahydrobiopterin dehydratase